MFDLCRSTCHTLSNLFVYATVNQRESVFGMVRNCMGFRSLSGGQRTKSEAFRARHEVPRRKLLRNDLVAPAVIEPAATLSATEFPRNQKDQRTYDKRYEIDQTF